jgi:hypothetical protein
VSQMTKEAERTELHRIMADPYATLPGVSCGARRCPSRPAPGHRGTAARASICRLLNCGDGLLGQVDRVGYRASHPVPPS